MNAITQPPVVAPVMDTPSRRSMERLLMSGAIGMAQHTPDTLEWEISCYLYDEAYENLLAQGMSDSQIREIADPVYVVQAASIFRERVLNCQIKTFTMKATAEAVVS